VPFVRRIGGRRAEDRILPQGSPVPPRTVVRLRVSDTGEGIRPEHLPRLFDPFFTTRASGTGLGLSICQSIIHEHGGNISAESSPGKGTTITLELPLEKRHGQRRKNG
jgi:signal transduction histidine kinase